MYSHDQGGHGLIPGCYTESWVYREDEESDGVQWVKGEDEKRNQKVKERKCEVGGIKKGGRRRGRVECLV